MQKNLVVSQQEWLEARRDLLHKEKEFTHLRDKLSKERRALPWVKVEKEFKFAGSVGEVTLADLFAGKNQLVVYHFMFDPDWESGCKSCSFWADNFNGIVSHLAQRDVTLLAISRAPLQKLEGFKHRMGWQFEWVSSFESDFNFDYGVSFTEESIARGKDQYNYKPRSSLGESHGISVFFKDENEQIFHTYSTYARGLDIVNGAYHYLDLTPKGRDEGELPWSMDWLRLHNEY